MARLLIQLTVLLFIGIVGRTFADEPERVVGGTNAIEGQFPYQVSLREFGTHFCGGTLITNKHVLTAAHCTIGLKPYQITVATGTISIRGGQQHRVKSIVIHKDYIDKEAASLVNDISVITLEEPIVPNAYQKPIRFATSDPAENSPLRLSGWGLLKAGGNTPYTLQTAMVYAVSNKKCAPQLHDALFDTQLCALNREGIGACVGDSGGPLVYNGEVVGIVSWAYPCALGIPDVYTRVSKYTSFINDAISRS